MYLACGESPDERRRIPPGDHYSVGTRIQYRAPHLRNVDAEESIAVQVVGFASRPERLEMVPIKRGRVPLEADSEPHALLRGGWHGRVNDGQLHVGAIAIHEPEPGRVVLHRMRHRERYPQWAVRPWQVR